MDAIKKVTQRAFLAGLLWALPLHLVTRMLIALLVPSIDGVPQSIMSGAAFFISFLGYPLMLSVVGQARTPCCWRNMALYAFGGSMAALLGILLLSAVAAAVWLIAGVAALGLWLLLEVVLPGLTRRDWLHLKQERNRSKRTWRQLAELSLLDILLCRLPRGH